MTRIILTCSQDDRNHQEVVHPRESWSPGLLTESRGPRVPAGRGNRSHVPSFWDCSSEMHLFCHLVLGWTLQQLQHHIFSSCTSQYSLTVSSLNKNIHQWIVKTDDSLVSITDWFQATSSQFFICVVECNQSQLVQESSNVMFCLKIIWLIITDDYCCCTEFTIINCVEMSEYPEFLMIVSCVIMTLDTDHDTLCSCSTV